MEKDLKLIKKKYGEKMMHYCRSELSTILEKEGLLPSLLLQHFNESHILYDDIEKEDKLEEFKNYIYSLIDVENDIEAIPIKETPKELLNKAGYDFYECKTEEDIQSFKKYYSKGEELCTFRGGRLKTCHVFFAVKKNVDEIKRKNFSNLQELIDIWNSINFTTTERVYDSINVIKSDTIYRCENVYRSTGCSDSKNIIYSDSCGQCEFLLASQRSFACTFCIRTDDSKNCSNSYNVICSNKVINSFFIQDCFNLNECMFCSHIANKKYCIANMQFEEEEYFEIKKTIISWILSA